jgi:phenylpyruvate tautomerase PptA (4-oxalocrotonate tautomerase family)
MPVIEISTLPPAGDLDVARALAAVTTEVASFLGEEPRGTWAIYRPIAPGHYAEGDDAPATQPETTHPAVVRVFANRPPEQAADLLASVGAAVTRAFGLEAGNVFVRFEPADPERMFWG